MNQKIISRIIFSEFNDIKGPDPVAFFPAELGQILLDKVSDITINYFMNETEPQESLYLVPFPVVHKKGLVRSIIWPETKKRGGNALASLTVVFDENNDSIFYKYLKDLEEPLDNAAKKIIELRTNNGNVKDIQEVLEDLHSDVVNILGYLSKIELQSTGPSDEFPESNFQSGGKCDYNFKIIVIGDPSVGKTSTVLRFSDNAFRRSYLPTTGVNISQKFIQHQAKVVQLTLWDLAGQAKYQQFRHLFYQGAHGAILVYDLTDRQSFENIPKWHADLINNAGNESNKIRVILCGNKKDLVGQRSVPTEDGLELARALHVDFFETSALSGENIEQAFFQLIETLVADIPGNPCE
ncbi:MAG TPA: GTP-binding protein [Candidatus Lokiarchaeia archaeon]|nr:GTP-binding protein [Candidatus Lokiarchaeia archaeon]